jgi:hypothetical protein
MEDKGYSISVRLRRTKIEYAFVSVPMDEKIMEQHPDEPENLRINSAKVFEIARRMASDSDVLWALEGEPLIEIHPFQTAPPRA